MNLIKWILLFRTIDEEALEQALSAAVTCTILAAAGPQRSRVLATLYKVNNHWNNTHFKNLIFNFYFKLCWCIGIWFRMNGVQNWKYIQYYKRFSPSFSLSVHVQIPWSCFSCLTILKSFCSYDTEVVIWNLSGIFGENFEKTWNWCIRRRAETSSGYKHLMLLSNVKSMACTFLFYVSRMGSPFTYFSESPSAR